MCAKNILVAAVLLAIVPMVAVAQDPPPVSPCEVTLIADGGSAETATPVGTVTATYDDVNGIWTITYQTDGAWFIDATHLHVACDPEDFPQTGALEKTMFTSVRLDGDDTQLTHKPVVFSMVQPGESLIDEEAGTPPATNTTQGVA